ncbi:MAG TPA: DUF1365 domain-containing protein [Micropepsaceae bacterium]|nr:DUF1365 domain-containing protein [Micropepsaceae bacterium]
MSQPRSFTPARDPKRNAFRYGVFYLRIRLEDLSKPSKRGLFSIDSFNLFSLFSRDYTFRSAPVREGISTALANFECQDADAEILLLTLPRVLGYAFNPVSFWLCYDAGRNLRAVIAMVNNTFGERHCYLCCHEDRRPIGEDDWLQADKTFHVSPFLAVEGFCRFRFACDKERIAAWINPYDSERLMLATSLIGKVKANWDRFLFCFFRYPLVTLRVITLIHYQAAKLSTKGLRRHHKPAPPLSEISR